MSINRWTDKEDEVHTYIMEYYSATKKNELMPSAATWMDVEMIRQWRKSERERQIPYGITYMWNLKYNINEISVKQKQPHKPEQASGWQGGKHEGGKNWEFGINIYKLLHTGWINNKVLLHSAGNNILWQTIMEKNIKKYMCITESLGGTVEINTL